MGYTNSGNQVINVSEMSGGQEREFLGHFRSFGRDDAQTNWNMLDPENFDGYQPSDARIELNIDDTYMFEDADEETVTAARDAYVNGWQDFIAGMEGKDLKAFQKAHGVNTTEAL